MNLPITNEEVGARAPAHEQDASAAQRRFARLLAGVIVAYLLLITLFHGDFWPFSRFPMFSRAGRPWSRALLREVAPEELNRSWLEVSEEELPGTNVSLNALHKNPDDISTIVGKMKDGVKPEQQRFLADYFAEARATRHFVLYAARGKFLPGRVVSVRFQPLVLLGPEGVKVIEAPASPSGGASPVPSAPVAPPSPATTPAPQGPTP